MQGQAQQPTDPNIMAQVNALIQTSMAETQRKAQLDKAKLQIEGQKMAQDMQENHDELIAKQQIEGAKITHDANMLRIENEFAQQQQIAEHNKELQAQQMQHVAEAQQANQAAEQQAIQQAGATQQLEQGAENVGSNQQS
jgi:hypothetical protein